MSRRLRVLLSAYSCEPGKGSEPEVGWQWARQMARWHDVTVLTRANNEASIREGLAREGEMPGLRFVYHDLTAPLLLFLKRQFGWHDAYYRWWQSSARAVIARLCRETSFDLLHHVTYAGARFPAAIFDHGVPTIWGPVGGFESMPKEFLPWGYPRELVAELIRNAANIVEIELGTLRRRAQKANVVIASTDETADAIAHGGVGGKILPTVGIHLRDFPPQEAPPADHLRLLFAGRLLYWKGVELALRALHASGANARLDFVGAGRFRKSAEALTDELGLAERVRFRGQVPRAGMLQMYSQYDAMLYPSLHDTGGFVLLEAMAALLPVICLDCAGPARIVADDCGVRVPLGSRTDVITHLAAAIRRYADDPALRRSHGRQARAHVGEHYEWDRKGEAMNAIYEEVLGS
jgi:glycosyltransferase involved in cell wall biosynthesis